jgi:hypothetical protein
VCLYAGLVDVSSISLGFFSLKLPSIPGYLGGISLGLISQPVKNWSRRMRVSTHDDGVLHQAEWKYLGEGTY